MAMAIVCGTDLSTSAEQAARVAALLAKRLGQKLVLVHVLEDLGDALVLTEQDRRTHLPEEKRFAQQAEALRLLGVEVEQRLDVGDPATVLGEAAEHADLVVVGYLGRRKPGRWLIGSVAERIARTSRVPTLVVRSPHALLRWLAGEDALGVAIGVDRTETSRRAVQWVRTLSSVGTIRPSLVHVAESEEQDLAALESTLARDLDHDLEVAGIRGRTELVMRKPATDTDAELAATAESLGAGLLVVGSHQRDLIDRLWKGSVSRGVLHVASMSVVVVPTRSDHEHAQLARPIRSVLVATDLSPLGNRAVAHGATLLPEGGTMHIVHAIPPSVTGLEGRRNRERREVEEKLARVVPPSAVRRGIRVERHVLEGDVAYVTCQAAERLGVDAVVMSSRGRSPLGAVVWGSPAHEVIAKSKRPVLVVRTGAP